MNKMKYAASIGTFALFACLTAAATASDTVEITSITTRDGKAMRPVTIRAQIGNTSTFRFSGGKDRADLLVQMTPVIAQDQTVAIEYDVSINRTVDGAPHLFDKQISRLKLRAKLGEPTTLEWESGFKQEWTANVPNKQKLAAIVQ